MATMVTRKRPIVTFIRTVPVLLSADNVRTESHHLITTLTRASTESPNENFRRNAILDLNVKSNASRFDLILLCKDSKMDERSVPP